MPRKRKICSFEVHVIRHVSARGASSCGQTYWRASGACLLQLWHGFVPVGPHFYTFVAKWYGLSAAFDERFQAEDSVGRLQLCPSRKMGDGASAGDEALKQNCNARGEFKNPSRKR
eukprot:3840122-Amphidinium_carterae.1